MAFAQEKECPGAPRRPTRVTLSPELLAKALAARAKITPFPGTSTSATAKPALRFGPQVIRNPRLPSSDHAAPPFAECGGKPGF